jgi:hypothetical protein
MRYFDENWDPLTNYAPSQHLVPAMELLDASIPFAEGADLIVDIPVDPRGTGDIYIDDLIQATVVIDSTDNAINCNKPPYLPSTHAHAQNTPTSLYHEKTWRQETNFSQRQD